MTTEITTDSLVEEIHTNVVNDRRRIIKAYDTLDRLAETDPLASAGSSDSLARFQDCLVKSNAQLIELLKVVKKDAPDFKTTDNIDKDDIYSTIEKGKSSTESRKEN